jgi:hypothetical protein
MSSGSLDRDEEVPPVVIWRRIHGAK